MSIVTSLLHANYKENLMTRFPVNKQTDFKGLFIFNHVAMAMADTSAYYQKTDLCVVNLLSAIFGDQRIKGFREKGEWSTGIKYCVQPP